MNRETAGKIAADYLKPIYGFALKRCRCSEDAEDLTQEIVMKVYKTLLVRDDIDAPDKFIWTAAHNALANYYRGKASVTVGILTDEYAESLTGDGDIGEGMIERETVAKLHREIAYLSKQQRKIVVAYYFDNKKQETIASEMSIPLGTVKWHLFEAKRELKKGMEIMRESSELKFNPIKFDICGISGTPGTKVDSFFKSAISQNIAYACLREAKSINEIADMLGVSPVYIESEAEYLAEYGFLTEKGGKYLCNILLGEATEESVRMSDEMYDKAAKIIANELYDELMSCGILDDTRIVCDRNDKNFLLWSLIPYIAAQSGSTLRESSVAMEEAFTIRPDGGNNIFYASIRNDEIRRLSPDYESLKKWFGPCSYGSDDYLMWQIDSEWSQKDIREKVMSDSRMTVTLLQRIGEETLTDDEYAYLAERGLIRMETASDGTKMPKWQVIHLTDAAIKRELIGIGDKIKESHRDELEALKRPYIEAELANTPKQLCTMQKFVQQFIFFDDGIFLLHCMRELVGSGKLKLPTEDEKRSLMTVFASK